MNICCRDHPIWKTKDYGGVADVECITMVECVLDLLKPGPLRVMYNNFKSYHGMTTI